MSFIDLLIQETTEKFGLGNKGIAVISALVSTLNHQESGGFAGFLSRFRQAGLTAHVNAWLQNDTEKTLTLPQLAAALEPSALQQIAAKTGLPLAQTSEVLAYLIPLLVGHLAAHNTTVSAQPDDIRRALWSNPPAAPAANPDDRNQPFSLQQLAALTKSRGLKLLRAFPFL